MATTDAYEEGAEEIRRDFTANDFRITRALDSLLISAKSITMDGPVSSRDRNEDPQSADICRLATIRRAAAL